MRFVSLIGAAALLALGACSTLTGGATVGPTANVSFGNQTRQMLNLWGTSYGVGVQNNTLYFRSASDFAWFVGGTHSDTALDPGAGGTMAMKLSPNGALSVRGLKQVDGATPVVAPYELQRLIVEATPATVGIAQRIDRRMDRLPGLAGLHLAEGSIDKYAAAPA